MNDFNDPTQTAQQTSEQDASKPVAYCQNCGKPLNREMARIVGPAVYCEACLAAKLAGYPSGTGPATGYAPVSMGGTYPPLPPSGEPNPGLAALLGFIPGVGAMYNEQYAKGIVHLIVFATLIVLSNASGIFGIFIAGWVFYMVIEAYHTARARRDGTPLPNPFGLSDIGERLGFGRAWPVGPSAGGSGYDAAQRAAQAARAAWPPAASAATPEGAAWGAPVGASYGQPAEQPPNYPYNPAPPQGYPTAYGQPVYAPGFAPGPTPPIAPRNRFPLGAAWLIALGTLFLLSTTGIFHGFPAAIFVGFTLIAFGAWTFIHKMTDDGSALHNDGSAAYQLRVLRALRGSVWLLLIGVLFLLNTSRLLTWHRSWPLFIILAGVMALLERSIYNSAASYDSAVAAPFHPARQASDTPPPRNSGTSIVPAGYQVSGVSHNSPDDTHQGGN